MPVSLPLHGEHAPWQWWTPDASPASHNLGFAHPFARATGNPRGTAAGILG